MTPASSPGRLGTLIALQGGWLHLRAEHGVAVALRLVQGARRTHRVSPRFDRAGPAGRRQGVALGAVHDAFVPLARQHCTARCATRCASSAA